MVKIYHQIQMSVITLKNIIIYLLQRKGLRQNKTQQQEQRNNEYLHDDANRTNMARLIEVDKNTTKIKSVKTRNLSKRKFETYNRQYQDFNDITKPVINSKYTPSDLNIQPKDKVSAMLFYHPNASNSSKICEEDRYSHLDNIHTSKYLQNKIKIDQSCTSAVPLKFDIESEIIEITTTSNYVAPSIIDLRKKIAPSGLKDESLKPKRSVKYHPRCDTNNRYISKLSQNKPSERLRKMLTEQTKTIPNIPYNEDNYLPPSDEPNNQIIKPIKGNTHLLESRKM
ncbi:unnamed protein product [Moneuplotes crassus]|uniref:Uncharacterized protein n=1 Tax=Euplotes crassus TaxID=5936 RepID=A0AAD2D956_EUPCR|nr:unnamed protein product [Moneuplotes crassus]